MCMFVRVCMFLRIRMRVMLLKTYTVVRAHDEQKEVRIYMYINTFSMCCMYLYVHKCMYARKYVLNPKVVNLA
jgi:hypothetical protein